ncbi:ATP-binding protein [Nonomuraea jabiensis]|uniref:Pimeloyl-ACP methyl ester carboxylesterase n=1 Tax=Nonomuraea jabiensis TaxID=882448 RepID=A0A7W9LGN1_9ACTN|nr:ATP-binding protein [Nonomuraea jabiensis]MBB5783146.1 pimeloyl-ACP methyl ester carboxylesterase [Nonomuraea jabiensis]
MLPPLLPETDDLPEHQQEALKAAFGIVAATRQHDPMPLRVGVLNLLARVSRSRPVLLIADDVQHFDRDTRDVLGFVMRRLAGHAVTVLLAARGHTPPDGFNPDLPVLPLAPLSRRAAAAVRRQAGATAVEVEGASHAVAVSRPKDVADLIREAVRATSV